MKYKFILLFIIFTMMMTLGLSAQNRAAVLPFTAGDNIDRFMSAAAGEAFNKALTKSDKYTVINQGDVFRQLTDVTLYLIREFDDQTAVRIGQAVGADVVFVGNVFKNGSKVQVKVKCIDVQSGTATFVKNAAADSESQLCDTSKVLAAQINIDNETEAVIDVQPLSAAELWTKNKLEAKNLDVTNQRIMQRLYGGRLAGGIVMAVLGTGLLAAGAGVLGWALNILGQVEYEYIRLSIEYRDLPYEESSKYRGESEYVKKYSEYSDFVDAGGLMFCTYIIPPILMTTGALTAILSAIPFASAYRVRSIYRKSTGQKLFAFLQRTSMTGGYDWAKGEATFAMAIKL